MAVPLTSIDGSQRRAARIAALACLIPFALIVYANFGLRMPLFAGNDLAETMRRIGAAERAFRLSLLLEVLYAIGVVILATALFVVLGQVNRHLALLATALRFVYAVTAMMMALSHSTVMRLVAEPLFAQKAGAETVQALVRMNSRAPWDQYYVGLVFWAIAATLIAWLWLKSGYIPAPLAWFGLIASAWCALCALIFVAEPGFTRLVNLWVFDTPMALYDIALSVWLLTKGLRVPQPASA
jgi:hypothetical protein